MSKVGVNDYTENGHAPDNSVVISVCIANYNGNGVLNECIQSVLDQESAPPLEIIVHDDCSTDNSVAYVESTFPAVRLLCSDHNVGFCAANNRMAQIAYGRYLLFLNNDAALHTDALKTLYFAAQSTNVPAILGLPQYDAASPGKLIDMGSGLDMFLNSIPILSPGPPIGMVTGACLWIPRELWVELGGFPAWFGSLAEDLYLCQRARLAGYPVIAIPHSGYSHWVGRTLGGGKADKHNKLSTTRKRRALTERNKTYVMVITYPLVLLVLVFPIHILLLGIEGLFLSTLSRDFGLWRDIYWRCFAALWNKRSQLLHDRHTIQTKRRIGLIEFMRPLSLFPHKLRLLLRHGVPRIT